MTILRSLPFLQRGEGKHLQGLEWEGIPGAVGVGVAHVPDAVHEEGPDDGVDGAELESKAQCKTASRQSSLAGSIFLHYSLSSLCIDKLPA